MSEPTKQPASAWCAESLRLTAFCPSRTSTEKGEWERLWKEKPASITQQPRVGSLREEGPGRGGWVTIEQHPLRIDIKYTPDPSGTAGPLAVLPGTFPEALAEFRGVVSPWFDQPRPNLSRLAVGMTASLPQTNRETGYRQLQPYLTHCRTDPDARDFLYQINRRRKCSALAGLEMNRIARWSVAAYHQAVLSVESGIPMAATGEAIYACRLELDINTLAEFRDDISGAASEIFNELVSSGEEIIISGETP